MVEADSGKVTAGFAPAVRAHAAVPLPGDRLLIVTDGVTEAAAPDGELFGDDRVQAWLQSAGPNAALADLVAQVRAYEAGEPASDDVGAVLLTLGPRN